MIEGFAILVVGLSFFFLELSKTQLDRKQKGLIEDGESFTIELFMAMALACVCVGIFYTLRWAEVQGYPTEGLTQFAYVFGATIGLYLTLTAFSVVERVFGA